VHREVYNKILVNMKNESLMKVNSLKKYAWVLQRKDKMGTVFKHNGEPPSYFCVQDTTVCSSQLYVHDVYHVRYYIPFYISLKKVIIVDSADSIYVNFIDHM